LVGGIVKGDAQRFDAGLFALLVDQANLVGKDAIVDADGRLGAAPSISISG
jgi:hypothetical protein